MRVILARHGDAVGTKGKFHGMVDTPLVPAGKQEASDLADHLKPFGATGIIASPLSRTMETAQIIGSKLGLPVQSSKALLPLNLGAFVGRPTDQKNVDALKQYLANPNEKIPGGESINQWAQRFIPFFNQYFFDDKSPGTIIMVTHGRNILLAKADVKEGNNLKYDNTLLLDTDKSTEHGGFALATPPNKVEIITPKQVIKGAS